jgi:hypothetical protein
VILFNFLLHQPPFSRGTHSETKFRPNAISDLKKTCKCFLSFFLKKKKKKRKICLCRKRRQSFEPLIFVATLEKTNRKGRSLPLFYADEPCGCSDSIAKLLNRIPLPEKSSKWAFDDREKAKHLKQNIAQHFLFSSEVFGRKCKTTLMLFHCLANGLSFSV